MTGVRLLAAFDKPPVRVALDWMTSLGLLGFIGGIGLNVYLGFTSPTAPQIETGQIFSWERTQNFVTFGISSLWR